MVERENKRKEVNEVSSEVSANKILSMECVFQRLTNLIFACT